MNLNENPFEKAERILKELSHVLLLDSNSRAVLKGILIGEILKHKYGVKSELLVPGEFDAGDIFFNEAKKISLERSPFEFEHLGNLAVIAVELDNTGALIAGEFYVDEKVREWFANRH